MRIFVDANILVSVLNKEYPLFTYTSRIVSLADTINFQVYTSPVCFAIAFYFAEKKHKTKIAKQKINTLCDHIEIAEATKLSVKKAIQNPAVNDFEDGLEYYAAIENKCHCIITEDVNDFYFSEVEILNSHNFYLKYMAKVR
jgi:predicted nucleic acid-binding protein